MQSEPLKVYGFRLTLACATDMDGIRLFTLVRLIFGL